MYDTHVHMHTCTTCVCTHMPTNMLICTHIGRHTYMLIHRDVCIHMDGHATHSLTHTHTYTGMKVREPQGEGELGTPAVHGTCL